MLMQYIALISIEKYKSGSKYKRGPGRGAGRGSGRGSGRESGTGSVR